MFKLFQLRVRRKVPGRPVLVGRFSVLIDGQNIHYVLLRSFRARHIWLKYIPEGGFQVTIPRFYNQSRLPHFLNQHSKWILRRISNSKESVGYQADPLPQNTILYLGKPVHIISREGTFRSIQFQAQTSELIVVQPHGQGNNEKSILMWLKEQAVKCVIRKVEYWSSQLKVSYNRITIRNQKSLWGSCSRLRNLNFNWRLIMLPEKILDYVVIHEVCHLKEMNHSARFWAIVAEYCPQWREHRLWLKRCHVNTLSSLNY